MALGYVYRQGLIHRDVKPANLLATVERGRVLDVKISDFGSVLNLEADTHAGVSRRLADLHVARAARRRRPRLPRRQYSLAAVLYHLIAGRPPFDAAHQAALMHQICNAEPPPLTGLRDGVPAALDADRARGAGQVARRAPRRLGRVRAGAVGAGGATARCRAARCARCSTPSASTCCARSTSSAASATSSCGRWCTARSGSATPSAHALYRKGAARRQLPHHRRRARSRCIATASSVAAARRRHLGGRDGLPGAEPRPARAQRRRGGVGGGDHGVVHARDDGALQRRPRATCSTWRSSACWCAACTPRTKRWHHPRRISVAARRRALALAPVRPASAQPRCRGASHTAQRPCTTTDEDRVAAAGRGAPLPPRRVGAANAACEPRRQDKKLRRRRR